MKAKKRSFGFGSPTDAYNRPQQYEWSRATSVMFTHPTGIFIRSLIAAPRQRFRFTSMAAISDLKNVTCLIRPAEKRAVFSRDTICLRSKANPAYDVQNGSSHDGSRRRRCGKVLVDLRLPPSCWCSVYVPVRQRRY